MLGDRLPTIYDVASDIFSICCKPGSKKMADCVLAYSQPLFYSGPKHLMKDIFKQDALLSKTS